jgi:ubiquitin-protein ligase
MAAAASAGSAKALKRLGKEFEKLRTTAPLPFVSDIKTTGSGAGELALLQWSAVLHGPAEPSPYAHGRFTLEIVFPVEYPIKPPKVRFVTSIYHPSVSRKDNGMICSDVVEKEWSPVLNVGNVFELLHKMLEKPSGDSPIDEEVGEVFHTNQKLFVDNARKWTSKHAK